MPNGLGILTHVDPLHESSTNMDPLPFPGPANYNLQLLFSSLIQNIEYYLR
jgi:hypothetical protein